MTIFDDFFNVQMEYLSGRIDWKGLTVIEYGAQHARHSLALLKLGAKKAMAIEGRQSNLDQVDNPDKLPLKTLCADIRTLANINLGKYDVGLIFGVLYHLDTPVAFLRNELPRIKKHLFIWSHYCNPGSVNMEQEGYKGMAYGDAGRQKSDSLVPMIDFWFEHDELLRCLSDNGFQVQDAIEMKTPVSPDYPGMMIYATRGEDEAPIGNSSLE